MILKQSMKNQSQSSKIKKNKPPTSQFALDHSIPFSFLIFYNSVLLGLTQHFHMNSPAHSLCCLVFSRCTQRAAKSHLTTRICPVLAQDVHFSLWVAQQFHIACSLRPITICVCAAFTRPIQEIHTAD